MTIKSIVIFTTSLLMTAIVTWGRITPLPKRVPELFEGADVIVKGEIVGIRNLGKAALKSDDPLRSLNLKRFSPDEMSATVLVDQVFKGNVTGKELEFRFLRAQTEAFTGFSQKEYALIFLKSRGTQLELLDADTGKFPAKRRKDGKGVSSEKGTPALIREFAGMADDADPETASEGLGALRSFTGPEAQLIMRAHIADKRIGVRAQAIAGLIENGDDEAAKVMVRELKGERMKKPSPEGREEEAVRNTFVQSLIHMRADKKNVVHAMELVEHEDPFIRKAAVDVLRMARSSESIPALAKFLESPDVRTQYVGVITLCEIARPNRRGCPSDVLFERKRDEYLAEWKAWAAAHPDGKP